jgi:hypothetical protein
MKRTIYIAVIVIALGGAAVMAYMAFFSGGSGGGGEVVIETEAQVYNILPEGKELDFTEVSKFNQEGRLFPYPQVTPSEIGQVLGNIIE